MKIDRRITEEKKVRCTGCRSVILLTPDDESPDGMLVSVPKKTEKPKEMSVATKRWLLMAALGIILLIIAAGIWFSMRGR
jgi:hypothetical protein